MECGILPPKGDKGVSSQIKGRFMYGHFHNPGVDTISPSPCPFRKLKDPLYYLIVVHNTSRLALFLKPSVMNGTKQDSFIFYVPINSYAK